jgi:Cu/Ag efflux protein CusF
MTRARLLTVVGAGIAGLLAMVPSEARSGGSSSANEPVSGTVEEVDTKNKAIALSGSHRTLTVTDQTQIVKDGQRATLSDVKEGDEVRASYSESGEASYSQSGEAPKVEKLDVIGGPSFTDQG